MRILFYSGLANIVDYKKGQAIQTTYTKNNEKGGLVVATAVQTYFEPDIDIEEHKDSRWYMIHTYSKMEKKTASNLSNAAKHTGLADAIKDIRVLPDYPEYIAIKMPMDSEIYNIIRRTKYVTGFVGPGGMPVPLTLDEAIRMGLEKPPEFQKGDNIKITSGIFKGFIGRVEEVNGPQIKVSVQLFGRTVMIDTTIRDIQKQGGGHI